MPSIEERVLKSVRYILAVKDAPLSSRLVEDLFADSLDVVELVADVETEFNISIPDEEAVRIYTVQQLVDTVRFFCKGTMTD